VIRSVRDGFRGSSHSVLALFLLICISSCYPEFKNPIPPPSELKADPHILGTWVRPTESGSKQELLIFPRSSGWIDVVLISDIDAKEAKSGINVVVLEGYNTSVNKYKFLCLRLREKDWEGRDRAVGDFYFLIATYETRNTGELVVRPFSQERVKELIEEGRLKGKVIKRGRSSVVDFGDIIVTSSSDELVELISREGIPAFTGENEEDTLVFSRSRN
jgi:hypothetical protein